jgi:uncharacterized RDD family membrane protein YckC
VTGQVSPVPREAQPYQGLSAGLASRLVANVIDAIVVCAVIVVGYLLIAVMLFLWRPNTFHFPQLSWSTFVLLGFFVSIAYFTLTWSETGRSYGDHVMGLRLINRSGKRVRLLGSLVRAICCVVFPIGLFWAAVDRKNHSLQDVILRTSVIYDWRMAPTPNHPPSDVASVDGESASSPRDE